MFRHTCIICGSSKLDTIIDLGSHPFADTFIPDASTSDALLVYPLICDLCSECGQIQLKCITEPNSRYRDHDYSYTSSNSALAREHWRKYAVDVREKLNLTKDSFIVEVGSNDGYLAEQFIKQGTKAIGVDASPCMADLAKKRNVDTMVGLFDSTIAKEIISNYGKADLVVANNVFNHADMPVEFALAAAELLVPNGTFVFELPYWYIGLRDERFDQIYHEHVSYFTVRSARELLRRAGMFISSVDVVDYHGGSVRFFAKRADDFSNTSVHVNKMIENEYSLGTFNVETYKLFMEKIIKRRNHLLQNIYSIKSKGGAILAVGAAAKGNTLLNFCNLGHGVLDYVTDSSVHKQGKYTPLTHIPICGDNVFAKYDDVYALILSWNISDELKEILFKINPKINFLTF